MTLPGDVTKAAAHVLSAPVVQSLLCRHWGNSYPLLQSSALVLLHFVHGLAVTTGCPGICCPCCWWQGLDVPVPQEQKQRPGAVSPLVLTRWSVLKEQRCSACFWICTQLHARISPLLAVCSFFHDVPLFWQLRFILPVWNMRFIHQKGNPLPSVGLCP